VGAVALPLAFAGTIAGAPPKTAQTAPPAASRPGADAPPASSSWVADELRILRADVEALRQRPETSVAAEMAALRSEVAKLASAQADLERRLAGGSATEPPAIPIDRSGGVGLTGALVFLTLGAALGWVASRLSQRWRDRRQRIRV
jgi:hypothetical protein